jgi:predicted RNA-binding protein with PUA domain
MLKQLGRLRRVVIILPGIIHVVLARITQPADEHLFFDHDDIMVMRTKSHEVATASQKGDDRIVIVNRLNQYKPKESTV